jgi:hypothetical protein
MKQSADFTMLTILIKASHTRLFPEPGEMVITEIGDGSANRQKPRRIAQVVRISLEQGHYFRALASPFWKPYNEPRLPCASLHVIY